MLRTIGVKYLDVPELSTIENTLRQCNETFRDRQVRVKLEAYSSAPKSSRLHSKQHSPELTSMNLTLPDSPSGSRGSKRSISNSFDFDPDDSEILHKKLKLENGDGLNVIPIAPYPARNWKGKHPKKNLFKNLVLTMNLAFSDYNFDSVKIEQFQRKTLVEAMNTVNSYFREMSSSEESVTKVFNKDLWTEIENVVGLPAIDPLSQAVVSSTMEGVQIYSYVPENEAEIDADPLSSLGNLWSFNFFFCNPVAGKVVFLACSCRQRKFSQTGDSIPDLMMQNSFYELWDEDEEELGVEPIDLFEAEANVGVPCQ